MFHRRRDSGIVLALCQSNADGKIILSKIRKHGFRRSSLIHRFNKPRFARLSRLIRPITAGAIFALISAVGFITLQVAYDSPLRHDIVLGQDIAAIAMVATFVTLLADQYGAFEVSLRAMSEFRTWLIGNERMVIVEARVEDLDDIRTLIGEITEVSALTFTLYEDWQNKEEIAPPSTGSSDSGPVTQDRLREAARALAEAQPVRKSYRHGRPLLKPLADSEHAFDLARRHLGSAAKSEDTVDMAGEWLLDNAYIIKEQINEFRNNLPQKFYDQVPVLAEGPDAGLPRVYGIAKALVIDADAQITNDNILNFVGAYQSVEPLTIGELWALPLMLRFAVIEHLHSLVNRIERRQREREWANFWANRLLTAARSYPERLPILFSQIGREEPEPSAHLAMQIVEHLYDEAEVLQRAQAYVERVFGVPLSELSIQEQRSQAIQQVSLANTISSLRELSQADWREVFEALSVVDMILRVDPAGTYAEMDFETRDQYRHAVEKMARWSGVSELDVAHAAVAIATGQTKTVEGHVGFHLVDRGRWALARKLGVRWPFLVRVQNVLRIHPTWTYVGSITLLTLAISLTTIHEAVKHHYHPVVTSILFLLLMFPASEIATQIVNWIATLVLPPRVLPKMSFEETGIPNEFKTLVVVPVMLLTPESIAHEIELLEVRYLANTDPNLLFALLSDYSDAKEHSMPEDSERLDVARRGIESLDSRYGPNKFFLFHREREWSDDQMVWMGYERKRGKLEDLNRYLMGASRSEVKDFLRFGSPDSLTGTRFIITLDADTQLPRETARKMVAALAHPLNRPQVNLETKRVERGYTIIQPRVTTSLPSANSTRFSRLFTDPTGVDPYASAVSDVYQDLTGEGIYHGKGIYDLAAFHTVLSGRFPDNHLLSHDLIEGAHVRTALASDIELFDLFPRDYTTFSRRQHRWTRGDWQIAEWILPTVPSADGTKVANPLTLINRWKVFDNLRRSLLPITTLLLLLVGWFLSPPAIIWSLIGILVVFVPVLLMLIMRVTTDLRISAFVEREPWATIGRALVVTALLPEQSAASLDAIIRVWYRKNVSHHGLLEWETASEAHQKSKDRSTEFVSRMYWISAAAFIIAVLAYRSLGPLPGGITVLLYCLLWCASPFIVLWLGQASVKRRKAALTTSDIATIRQYARRTWRFFDHFVGPQTNWLPPDNYQEIEANEIAARTSPTNIGLWFLTLFVANDLGYLPLEELASRLSDTFVTLNRLERYEGHFLNWYETDTATALRPRYLSMVDSGNLLGSFWTLSQSCREVAAGPILGGSALQGLVDVLGILHGEMEHANATIPTAEQHFKALAKLCEGTPNSVGEIVRRVRGARIPADALLTLIRAHENDPDSQLIYWAKQVVKQVKYWNGTIDRFLSWVDILDDLPAQGLLHVGEHAHEWRREALASNPSLSMLDQDQITGIIALIAAKSRITPDERSSEFIEWLDRLEIAFNESRDHSREILGHLKSVREDAERLADEMNMAFLYDSERTLFRVGYNIDDHRMDNFYYDLLASEARLGSFCSVAVGSVPVKHWVSMGRAVGEAYNHRVLMSWNGTMFEYLMPVLFTKLYENTLLKAACENAVEIQIAYGKQRGVPWGISEAGFSAIDFRGVYQYYAFGVPGLGLRRQADDMLVVAPYASALALMIDPVAALQNLRRLANRGSSKRADTSGMLGQYGFFEAIDYSRQRDVGGIRGVVVRSYMAHHQGMSLLAIDNVVNDNIMQKRFHADARVRSTESLLHERIPTARIIEGNNDEHVSSPGERRRIERVEPAVVSVDTWESPHPRTHMLSNGKYSVMVTNAGGGYSRWNGYDITRWLSDATCDAYGTFCYIKDRESQAVWASTRQPMIQADRPQSYKVMYSVEKAEIRRRDNGIEVITEIAVSPEDDAEIRRMTFVNHSSRPRELELTSYVEIALNQHEADRTHPAFSKLFVQTEALPEHGGLLAWRRPKSSEDSVPYAMHVLSLPNGVRAKFEYETARLNFIGRGRDLSQPIALETKLTNTDGAVMDPVFSLRYVVKIAPGERVHIAFVTAASDSRDAALHLAAKYADLGNANRAFDLAWNHAQLDLRHLRIQPNEAMRYQQLASYVLYPDNSLRPSQDRLRLNKLGKSHLWAYGISGDLPITSIVVGDTDDIEVVKQVVKAHAYWRIHGLTSDLVIIDQEAVGYVQPLQEQLRRIVDGFGHFTEIDKPGGVFLRAGRQMAAEDLNLLLAASRIVLVAARGSLAQQLGAISQAPALQPPPRRGIEKAQDFVSSELPFQELQSFNGLGGFFSDGKEYSIYMGEGEATPAPWVNVMANKSFGALVSESGSGTMWYGNSQSNRLIPWANDAVLDPSGDAIYIRDEYLDVYWTPTPQPIRENDPYRARHGQGYTIFEHNSHGIDQILTTFVPLDHAGGDPVKVQILTLKNRTQNARKLTVTPYVEWVLGTTKEETQPNIITSFDQNKKALFARNPFNPDFSDRVAFLAMSPKADTCTGDRTEFIGRCGSVKNPGALNGGVLSNRTGASFDPCGALQGRIELKPGETKTIVVLTGEAASEAEALALMQKYSTPELAQAALDTTKQEWDTLLETVQVQTPDSGINALLNRWLLYQTISCRIWGRTGFYQSSGAFGFRDQLQDVLAVLITEPNIAKQQILRAAGRQFIEGDVQHWWHPITGAGTRTQISDDLLWLTYVVAQYVRVTGDQSILDEVVPFIEGAVLAPDEHERYFIPDVSPQTGTILEHCLRAVKKGLTAGPHGLPLIGGGDWNDGLNRVGVRGTGESTWLGWFLVHVLGDLSELLEIRKDSDQAAFYLDRAAEIIENLEKTAWDGEWYLRGFYDDGTPLGSHDSEEMIIDSLPQSWSVISRTTVKDRSRIAMQSVAQHLVKENYGAVLLFTPPFDKTSHDPGYIKGYIPGVRENGGQYTHGSLWVPMAFARLGDGDTAVKLLTMMGPLSHARDRDSVNAYRVEPYVVVADIYSADKHEGQGGWTWYTGAAGWMYNVWITEVLGVRKMSDTLIIDPAIPNSWNEYSLRIKHGLGVYNITVENPKHVSCGVESVELDGASLESYTIPLSGEEVEHTVRIVLGDGPRPALQTVVTKNAAFSQNGQTHLHAPEGALS